MGEEDIHSLYLQRKDTSSHGPSAYRTGPVGSNNGPSAQYHRDLEIMACI